MKRIHLSLHCTNCSGIARNWMKGYGSTILAWQNKRPYLAIPSGSWQLDSILTTWVKRSAYLRRSGPPSMRSSSSSKRKSSRGKRSLLNTKEASLSILNKRVQKMNPLNQMISPLKDFGGSMTRGLIRGRKATLTGKCTLTTSRWLSSTNSSAG